MTTIFQKNPFPVMAAVLATVLTLFSACRKDPQEIVELLTSSEAAEIIETAVANKTAGFTMPAIDAAQIIETYLNSCNVPGDTSIHKNKGGGVASYDYTFNIEWLVTCSNLNVPQTAQVDIAANGNFTSLHWSGNDATAGTLVYSGLSPQETAYMVNGTYDLEGDITGSLRRTAPSLHCLTELTLVNLTIDKSTLKITGGTGTAKVTGTSANGDTKTLDAALVFTGNNSVEVTVNGYSYTFDWQ